jgi:hypothetical protein
VGYNGYEIAYNNSVVEVKLEYWLEGGDLGSYASKMHINWNVENLTGDTVNFNLFQVSDFDLGGDPTDDSVAWSKNIPVPTAPYAKAIQLDTLGAVTNTFSNLDPINIVEAGDASTLFGKLDNLSIDSLNGVPSAVGPEDLAFGAQWSLQIEGNGFRGNGQTLSLTVVPEPSSAALLLGGLLVLRTLRRRGSNRIS